MAEHARARELDSHREFMRNHVSEHGMASAEYTEESKAMISADEIFQAKQKMRRAEALKTLAFETFAFRSRVDPTLKEIRITDEKFMDLRLDFAKMQATFKDNGDLVEYNEDGNFIPLSQYAHKVTKFRHLVKGEVGMMGSQIVVLEDGYGTGKQVSVARAVEK